MRVVGIARVKDEADILPHTVRRMLGQVDHVIVQDNASRDGTRELLAELATADERVTVLDDPEVGYWQSEKMSALAQRAAAEHAADWVVPFDADEVWYSPFGRIADVLAGQDAVVATAALYDHLATSEDPVEDDPTVRLGWRRRNPTPLPKVACRPLAPVTIHQGNHGADHVGRTVDGLLVVRHFPYRSASQMIRKARNGAAAYAATDLPDDVGKHWRDYGRLTDEQITEVFHTFFYSERPDRDRGLIYDPAP